MFHFPLQTVKWPEGNSFYNSFFQYLRRWTQLYSTDHLPIISCHFASKTPAIWAPAPRLPRPSRDKCGRRAGPVERFTEHPQLISCDLCESEQSFFFACLEYVRYNRYYILYIDIVHFCIWPSLCRCFFVSGDFSRHVHRAYFSPCGIRDQWGMELWAAGNWDRPRRYSWIYPLVMTNIAMENGP